MKIASSCLIMLAFAGSSLAGTPGAEPTARRIMEMYDSTTRHQYKTFFNRCVLTTSKYAIKDGVMKFTGSPRVVQFEGVRKFSNDQKDFKSTAFVFEPASDKGVSLLYYEYFISNKDNDNWMFLPALGKVKRIIADTDGSGSFLGSEFTIEDKQTFKVDEYEYKLLGEGTFDGRPVWKVECIPTAEKLKKTAYSKKVYQLDKERLLRLREDLYNRNGKLVKVYTVKDVEFIDDVWIARVQIMNNLATRRISTVDITDQKYVSFNIPVEDEFFTHRAFTDLAYREQVLDKMRHKYWN